MAKTTTTHQQNNFYSNTEEPRSKASVNSVIRSIRHVFKSPNFFLFFSLVKHSANKAFGNKANRAIRHDFFNPMVFFYSAIAHFHFYRWFFSLTLVIEKKREKKFIAKPQKDDMGKQKPLHPKFA